MHSHITKSVLFTCYQVQGTFVKVSDSTQLEAAPVINIEHTHVGEIPLLHVVQEELNTRAIPLIIFVHGFESAVENNLHYAYLLAKKGFRVVLPEAIYHGERQAGLSSLEMNMHFWDIVTKTIDELKVIKEYFERENKIDIERIGVAGTSMGGIVTLGALTQYPWIKAAVSLMGMPYYEKFSQFQLQQLDASGVNIPISDTDKESIFAHLRKYDLSQQPEKLNGRPLLFWHGVKDPTVPYTYTYQFYESIRPLYQDIPEKLQFISDEKAEHKVSREGVLKLVDWFDTYLASPSMIEVTTLGERMD